MAGTDLSKLKGAVYRIKTRKEEEFWGEMISRAVHEYIWERDDILTEEEELYINSLSEHLEM